jgi:hypothetical protein
MTQKWLADFLMGIWIYIIGITKRLDSIWQELQDPEGRERVLVRVKAHFREYVVYYVFAVLLFVGIYGLWVTGDEDGEDVGMARASSQGKVKKIVMTGGTGNTSTYYGIYESGFTDDVKKKLSDSKMSYDNKKNIVKGIMNKVHTEKGITEPNKTQGTLRAENLLTAHNKNIRLTRTNKTNKLANEIGAALNPNTKTVYSKANLESVLAQRKGSDRGKDMVAGSSSGNQAGTKGDAAKGSLNTVPATNPQVPVNAELSTGQQANLRKLANASGGRSVSSQTEPEKGTNKQEETKTNQTKKAEMGTKTGSTNQQSPDNAASLGSSPAAQKKTKATHAAAKQRRRRGTPVSQLQASAGAKVSVTVVNPPAAPAAPSTNNKAPKPVDKQPEANQPQTAPVKPQQAPAQGPQKDARKDQGAEGVKQAVEAALAKKEQKGQIRAGKKQETKQLLSQYKQASAQFKRKTPGGGTIDQLLSQVKQGVGQQFDRIGGILFSLLTVLGLATAAGTVALERTGFAPAKRVITMASRI